MKLFMNEYKGYIFTYYVGLIITLTYCKLMNFIKASEIIYILLFNTFIVSSFIIYKYVTTKRAYEELEKQNLINTVPGKGCYVSSFNKELVYEAKLREIEDKLEESINLSKIIGLQKSELISILESLYEGD